MAKAPSESYRAIVTCQQHSHYSQRLRGPYFRIPLRVTPPLIFIFATWVSHAYAIPVYERLLPPYLHPSLKADIGTAVYPWIISASVICAVVLLCLAAWRLWQYYAVQLRRNNAMNAAFNAHNGSDYHSSIAIQRLLIRHGMEATGAALSYLTLFTPDPTLACHAQRNEATRSIDEQTCPPPSALSGAISVPLGAREFWAPLLDGEPYVLHEGARPSRESGYPVEKLLVTRHLAVALMRGHTPLAVLGVANAKARFTQHDIHRLRTLLSGLWRVIQLHAQLEDRIRNTQRAQSILDHAPFGMALLDGHGNILENNPALQALFPECEIVNGRSIFSLVPTSEYHTLENIITRVQHMGERPISHEMEYLRHAVPRIYHVSFVRLSVQSEFQLLLIVEDRTSQHEALQQVETFKNKLQQMVQDKTIELQNALSYAESTRDRIDLILRSTADGILVTDIHNRIIIMNHSAENYLGLALRDAIGMQIGKALGNAPFRLLLEERVAQSRTGGDREFSFQIPSAQTRQTRYLRATSSPILDQNTALTGVVTILHDATQEWHLDTLKSEFLSMAAHELRTPLTSIQGYSDLLLNRHDLTAEERERFLKLVNTSAQTLSGIVSDLLDISRIESGRGFSLKLERLDVTMLTRNIVEAWNLRNADDAISHHIHFDETSDEAIALIDKNKYAQILENLFSNSVKYSPNGGDINVHIETDDAIIMVTVTDYGIGMTMTELERVFEKFFRAHAEDGAIQGTGLGMTIVKHLVEAFGGEIAIQSVPGEGTSVSITFPTASVAVARPKMRGVC